MNQLIPVRSSALPALVAVAGERASMRFLEFFAANIRNPHTRRAYARAADEFLAWCASAGVPSIGAVQPLHVAIWIVTATRELAAPSVKQRLAAIRHLFDWLVTGQVVPVNPAGSVRGPPACRDVPANAGARSLGGACVARQHRHLDPCRPARSSVDRADGLFLRPHRCCAWHDGRRCLYARPPVMGAAARERRQPARDAVSPEPRGIPHSPSRPRGLAWRSQGAAVRTIGRGTGQLTRTVLPQTNAYAMIRRRAAAAGIATKLGKHSFRSTGIPAYLKNGGTLEKAAAMANHASTRTTRLYDRRRDEVSLDEVERIAI